MRVIAERKSGLLFLYGFCLFCGLFAIVVGFIYKDIDTEMFITGILLTIISLILVIRIASTPKNIIVYDTEDNNLIINKKTVISIKNLFDVSYKRASAKAIQYRWGTVIINKTIKCRYVSECEEVSKRLTHLMYTKKNEMEWFYED